MKLCGAAIALSAMFVVLPSVQAFQWEFIYANPQVANSGDVDQGCTQITNPANTQFQYVVPSSSNCCIIIYTDDVCGEDWGSNCASDWTQTIPKAILSFRIFGC
jgi:hypothetical protein